MRKKIGIVTWYHKGYNFGSTLQAYATQTVLEKRGYETELINYSQGQNKTRNRLRENLKNIVIRITKPKVYIAWIKIDKWIKRKLKISKPYTSWNSLKSDSVRYDAVICGSDQIWRNPKDGIIEPFYFLQFVNKSKRIAYAPSIARDYIDERIINEFRTYVQDINYLSVREKQGADLIKEITGKDAKIVLDPTLLLKKDEWEEQLKTQNDFERDYIFCYLLTKNEHYWYEVVKVSKKYNLEIVTPAIFSNYHNNSRPLDPFEFLNLIRFATYVVTDSFHGVAFSIIFQKQFAVYKRFPDTHKRNQNSRIYNILTTLDLNQRLIGSDTDLETVLGNRLEYDNVNNLLGWLREDSLTYLENSLKSSLTN